MRGEALVFFGRHLAPGWSVADRLDDIAAPTVVMAGADDFVFPPVCQAELAAGIPNARLQMIERAGHNPHSERTEEALAAIREFLSARVAVAAA